MKTFLKMLNKSVWSVLSLFFVIAFIISLVGEGVVRENENNINYALGIRTYKSKTTDTESDSEYYKSDYYKADGKTYDDAAMRAASVDVGRKAAADGAVLLWNNGALPLAAGSAISFFGVSSKPKNWLYTGHGSGRVSVTTTDFPDLKAQFESEKKYTVNPTLWNSYTDSTVYGVFSPHADDNHYREFSVNEKAWNAVNSAASGSFASYGDAAIYFITRTGAEDGDTWFDTSVNTSDKHVDNNYLDLTANEQDTIKALVELKKNKVFSSVVLVLNTGTPMNMKTIKGYDIDACLWAGMGGNASFAALYDVMSGAVNPSGRLVDTYVYHGDSAPSAVNTGAFEFTEYGGLPTENRSSNAYNHAYIVYQEGIYVGYRYYETRYEDAVTAKGNASGAAGVVNGSGSWKYGDEVAYAFGHGLSYTSFDYTSFEVKKNGNKFDCAVTVKNTGELAGKHTVQIYLQKPYTDYDKNAEHLVEKAAVELVGYAKTDVIEPKKDQTVHIPVDMYEFKSYDAYGQKTYILEKGDYYLATGVDAHAALNNILDAKGYTPTNTDGRMDAEGNKALTFKHNVAKDDFVKYSASPTGETVTNRFSNADINLYRGTSDQSITYLSRSDWQGTYPTEYYKMHARNRMLVKDMQYYSKITVDKTAVMPTYGKVTSPVGTLSLIMLKDLDYGNELWGNLLDQLTWEETVAICGIGNHVISAAESINSPEVIAHDGPAGVKVDTPEDVKTFMAFPCGVLLASTFDDALVEQVGKAFGTEMLHAGVGEIYGTGAGVHRSVYGGRNWEYFSEDGFISGKILAAEVRGLQSKGAIVNIKHLVLNDQEIYRCGTSTWANEQSIREIYLKAFEAGITEGKANGVMSSLNRIGATWAGRHKGLLTDVLRGEWGFNGFVETDAATGLYMRYGDARANAVIAGNDLWLRGTNNESELWGDYKNNATVCQALRESCHRILYTVLNSSAMNGFNSSTRLVYVKPWYYGAITAAQAVTGILTFVCLGLAVTSFVLPAVMGRKKAAQDTGVGDKQNEEGST